MSGELVTECCWECDSKAIVETHWRFAVSVQSWPICAEHIDVSREQDASFNDPRATHLHLPIVQPVVDSEQAIAMEVALHAACRLLRICKGDDEAEQTLALLRQAQAEAWERVNGKEAA